MKKITAFFTLALALLFGVWEKKTESEIPVALPALKSRSLAANVASQPKAANSVAAKAPIIIDTRKRFADELMRLHSCYGSGDCAFPQTDPRSYEIALGKEIASKLARFRKLFPRDPMSGKLARKFMRTFDGFVQEEALKMLSDLPISPQNLAAITDGLNNTPDATLMKQALPELQRYMGSTHEAQIHSFLGATLSSGAHFTAEEVSLNISPFITNQSYTTYKQASDILPPGATAKRNLNSALREYRRSVTGA